ncbi:hypothetical protein F2Q69_00037049 [Brassica cretica]|uniref:Uncharacterized protein n=1 Tax=Brassica cretica TaxID=69181 RepID=A0A8S9SJU7_BRACR|nr:hypothetical protein F2Q69_00037049 [Brassica cretica]
MQRHGARDTNQIYLPRRRQRRISPALGLLDKATPLLHSCGPVSLFYVLFICSCYLDSGRKANSTDGTTKTRTLCCASSGGPFLPTNLYSSDESRGFSCHRNASVFGFKGRRISFCSPSDKSQCALCLDLNVTLCDYSSAVRLCREGSLDAFKHRLEFAVIFD